MIIFLFLIKNKIIQFKKMKILLKINKILMKINNLKLRSLMSLQEEIVKTN